MMPDHAFTPDSWDHLSPKPPLDIATVVLLAQSAEDVFARCVTLALQTTRATTATLALLRPEQDVLEVIAAAGRRSAEARGRQLRRGEALGWRVIETGTAQLLNRAQLLPDAHFLAGRPVPATYLGVPLLDPDGHVLGVLSADTTESDEHLGEADARALMLLGQAAGVAYSRWRALERAQRTARQFELLAQLSARFERLTHPEDIAREALTTLLSLSGFTVGAVVNVDAQGLVQLSVLEGDPESRRQVADVLGIPHTPRGVIGEVLATNRSVAVKDYLMSPYAVPGVSRMRSAVAAPLRSGGQPVGVIGLMHLDEHVAIEPEILTLLDVVAARIDHALERAAALDHLQQTREAAVRAMGRVIEGRDGETFGHTDRVTTLAGQLGQALALAPEQLQHLRWGAYLHDIGKVTVPDALLLKAGPLTPDERTVMQAHVIMGDHMLRDEIFVPREVRAVVRSHHERWDGTGYPDGLAGEDIPLLARIFSVVDVYDALVSERPYKRAWLPGDALAEIRRSAGTQFDPDIAGVFCDDLLAHGQTS
ncbi:MULTISPECIES: HD domain-containing phosphohydrolase [Deinococcus]|uniref:HD domain-containing phosphohydrolase n=1 Tax=Deinococcus rufus TaxID=2136097 RepID=A0ABV7ZAT5_9DEIO|nr:HD domain-containing phosphohydrolase [Deinococcus sp. AB2017081]WQE94550.1 GAF domain-containing protein [Deinococcus sp. AB2017081]